MVIIEERLEIKDLKQVKCETLWGKVFQVVEAAIEEGPEDSCMSGMCEETRGPGLLGDLGWEEQ